MGQALRNNLLWKEFAEHEARSMCLQHELNEAELVRSDLKADVAIMQEDVCGARKNVQWARQYRGVENRKIANLEMEVLSAHAELESEQRQVRTMAIADELRSVQTRSEALKVGRAELKRAEESWHGVQAVEELRARRNALQLEFMRDEHQVADLEERIGSLQTSLSLYRRRRADMHTRYPR